MNPSVVDGDLSVLVVTSPAPSHPATDLLDRVLLSLVNVFPPAAADPSPKSPPGGASPLPVLIVFDGYRVLLPPAVGSGAVGSGVLSLGTVGARRKPPSSKRGQVYPEAAERYEAYKKRVMDNACPDGEEVAGIRFRGAEYCYVPRCTVGARPLRHGQQQNSEGGGPASGGRRWSQKFADAGLNLAISCLDLGSHHGFAHCVKAGLLHLQALRRERFRGDENDDDHFALILQHDRIFTPMARGFFERFRPAPGTVAGDTSVHGFSSLMGIMRSRPWMRYVGFAHSRNAAYAEQLCDGFGLCSLLEKERICVEEGQQLRKDSSETADADLLPLVFWHDSNHLAHVGRYLRIFTPLKSLPERLLKRHKEFRLNLGDFIEETFGVAQRRALIEARGGDDLGDLFRWFGSYLLLMKKDEEAVVQQKHDRGQYCRERSEFVGHIRGRRQMQQIVSVDRGERKEF